MSSGSPKPGAAVRKASPVPGAKVRAPRRSQARGMVRREALIEAARQLLAETEINQINLSAIAERAGIPVGSAYHFYSEPAQIYKELAHLITIEMIGGAQAPLKVETWQEIVGAFIEEGARFFNANPAARQLMLGGGTPPEIKHAACREDNLFGDHLRAQIAASFEMPALDDPEGLFFRAIQIADTMFCLSTYDHDIVTEPGLREAKVATIAYLETYLPRIMPRKRGQCDDLSKS